MTSSELSETLSARTFTLNAPIPQKVSQEFGDDDRGLCASGNVAVYPFTSSMNFPEFVCMSSNESRGNAAGSKLETCAPT